MTYQSENINSSAKEHKLLVKAILDLLNIRAIERFKPSKQQFLSPIFLVPKSNGDNRFILNLKRLNKYVTTHHFNLEDIRTATKLVTPGCYFGNIDLKDAYFSVNIKETSRNLRFQWQKQYYEF